MEKAGKPSKRIAYYITKKNPEYFLFLEIILNASFSKSAK